MNGQAPPWLCRPADTRPPTVALLCFDSHWVESKFFLRAQVMRVVLGECAFMYYLTTMFKHSKTQRLGFPGTQHRAPVGPPRPASVPCALKTGLHPQLPPHFPLQSCQSSPDKKGTRDLQAHKLHKENLREGVRSEARKPLVCMRKDQH